MSFYRFPRTKFADRNTLSEQIDHVYSELVEVHTAHLNFTPALVAEELVDLIHSAETALRILEKEYDFCIEAVVDGVKEKNLARNYYNISN
ncbi:MAG: hypothetical protein HGA87_01100 [Desulfobulbaceae bacterium]|nr:hypothetical protein [Desulfobulbaceae bacterium]